MARSAIRDTWTLTKKEQETIRFESDVVYSPVKETNKWRKDITKT